MPRIISIVEVNFVEPNADGGYVHPLGYEVQVVRDRHKIAHYARLFELSVESGERQAARCAEHGHENPIEGCRTKITQPDGWSGWACEGYLRSARSAMRTDERTLLVKVTVPV